MLKVHNVYLWALRTSLQKQLVRACEVKDNKGIDRLETAVDDITLGWSWQISGDS